MKNRNLSDMLKKASIIFTVIIMFMMSIGLRNISYADEEIEEWEESGTVLLDKVSYSRKKKTLTVEITETSGELSHEYELYMLAEGELPDAIGRYLNLGKIHKVSKRSISAAGSSYGQFMKPLFKQFVRHISTSTCYRTAASEDF